MKRGTLLLSISLASTVAAAHGQQIVQAPRADGHTTPLKVYPAGSARRHFSRSG